MRNNILYNPFFMFIVFIYGFKQKLLGKKSGAKE